MKCVCRFTDSNFKKRKGLLAAAFFVFFFSILIAGEEPTTDNPYRVEAAFLRNFTHYVTWPEDALPGNGSVWNVCVLGSDPFGKVLEATLARRTEQGRGFKVFRAETLDELPFCQIVFIAYRDSKSRKKALAALKGKKVLTVSDAPGFLQEGGVIQFHVGERVRMNINLDQARAVSLKIPTKMLEVSGSVLENGIMRKVSRR